MELRPRSPASRAEPRTTPAGLDVTVTYDSGVPVLQVVGELDVSTVDVLDDALRAFDGEPRIIVDMATVHFADSRGIEPVMSLLRDDPDRVTLRRPSAAVHRLVRAVELAS